jgi:hypothetical protein
MASPYSTQPNLPVVVPRYADEPSMPAGATGTLFVLASGFGIGALVMLFGFLFLIGVGQVGHPTTSGPAAQSAATRTDGAGTGTQPSAEYGGPRRAGNHRTGPRSGQSGHAESADRAAAALAAA